MIYNTFIPKYLFFPITEKNLREILMMINLLFRTIPDLPNPITQKPFAYENPPLKPITGEGSLFISFLQTK